MEIGLLHPGEMGAGVASVLVGAGHRVLWVPDARSNETATRARAAGLEGVGSLDELVQRCGLIMSICPPHAALDVARAVVATPTPFRGVYLDANAISPGTAALVGSVVTASGARYLDGGITGAPPPKGRTYLYLSGPDAQVIAELLSDVPLGVIVLGDSTTAASTLKMAYAAWTKGTNTLILAIRATAKHFGLDEELVAAWERSQPELLDLSDRAAAAALTRGWRWIGEMAEISATFREANIPDGVTEAAGEIYRRVPRGEPLAKDEDLQKVLDAVLADDD